MYVLQESSLYESTFLAKSSTKVLITAESKVSNKIATSVELITLIVKAFQFQSWIYLVLISKRKISNHIVLLDGDKTDEIFPVWLEVHKGVQRENPEVDSGIYDLYNKFNGIHTYTLYHIQDSKTILGWPHLRPYLRSFISSNWGIHIPETRRKW